MEERIQNENLSEAEWLKLSQEANKIQRGVPRSIPICGKTWKLRPISMKQGLEISNLAFEATYIQEEASKEDISKRKLLKLNRKLRQLAAKQAAHYVLGRKLWKIPFVYSYMWRKIFNNPEEVSATINSTVTVGGNDKDFYIANLENLKFQLVLSMRQVGEAVKQMQERKESTENMLEEDALPKKEEGSKSGAHSKRPRTTKR